MRRHLYRIKGLGFILWRARHEFYHVMLGLVWAWILRERWNEFNTSWVWLSIFGSLLPDIEHFTYFLTYGRHDDYTVQIKDFLKTKQWRNLTVFIENGHKHNTNLSYHNIFFVSGLFVVSLMASVFQWRIGVIVIGAMISHYLFDMFDDYVTLGYLNENWKRWGRKKLSR